MPQPNLLFLICDQLQKRALQTFGGQAPSPTYQRLADRGALFERCYCAAPLCVPTRASMMTGLFPFAHGAICFGEGFDTLRPDAELLCDRLLDAGYHVGYHGMWHLHAAKGRDRTGEFAHFEQERFPYQYANDAVERAGLDPGKVLRAPVRTVADDGEVLDWTFSIPTPVRYEEPIDTHMDMNAAHTMAAFLRDAPADKPFAAWCSIGAPHPPLVVPEPYFSMFRAEDMRPPASFTSLPANEPRGVSECPGRQCVRDWTWEQWAPCVAAYLGYAAFADSCMGVVLDALDATGRADDTIIVAVSDHGEMLGAHRLYQKEMPFENAANVPLAIVGPGVTPGRRAQLAMQVDLAPTILDLLGLEPLPHTHGRSLRDVLADPNAPTRDFIISTFDGEIRGGFHWRAAIGPRYKYIFHGEGAEQLFDPHADPDEIHNLIDDADHAPGRDALRQSLRQWMRDHDDPMRDTFESAVKR
jgi:arylsulfatase A-like enzyme